MAEEEVVDSPGFVRQRRNLIVASLVLAFAQSTHLAFHKLNFFGAEANIERPISTLPFLWILCAYFLWRYWQAFSAATKAPTAKRYEAIKKILLQRIAVRRGLLPYREQGPALVPGSAELNAWMPHDVEQQTETGARVLLVTNIAEQSKTGATGQRNIHVDLTHSEIRWIRIRALTHLLWTSDEFSEYFLPFLMPLIPLSLFAWQLVFK